MRSNFVSLLTDGGMGPPMESSALKKYNNNVDKVFTMFGDNVRYCMNSIIAIRYFDSAKYAVGTRTRFKYMTENIILDGELPGVFSNKAFLERVIVKDIPSIFKFPQHPSEKFQYESVMRDVAFTDIMSNCKGFIY